MIEFSRSEIEDFNPAGRALTLERARFYEYRVRINGIEWKDTSTKEFKEAWNKDILWRELQR